MGGGGEFQGPGRLFKFVRNTIVLGARASRLRVPGRPRALASLEQQSRASIACLGMLCRCKTDVLAKRLAMHGDAAAGRASESHHRHFLSCGGRCGGGRSRLSEPRKLGSLYPL